jgi:hypothetical protein
MVSYYYYFSVYFVVLQNCFVDIPDSTKKPESEEEFFRSCEAGGEPADCIDDHGRYQSLLTAEAVTKASPDVATDKHA